MHDVTHPDETQRPRRPRRTLRISIDADIDFLWALVPGETIDGHLDDETKERADGVYVWTRGPDGPVIGFGVEEFSRFDAATTPDKLWRRPRSDVPTLGLRNASIAETVLAAQTMIQGSTPDLELFDHAVHLQETEGHAAAENAWRDCLATGNMKAHYGLGYTLVELGRPREAYGHLRAYAEIVPRNSWAWVWLGRACQAMGEREEAATAYRRAIEAEECGSYETDADELLAALTEEAGA